MGGSHYTQPQDARLPAEIVARLVLGIPDDLGWRGDHPRAPRRAAQMALALAVTITVAALLAVAWLGRAQALPVPVPLARAEEQKPPPPPPPPPPPSPRLSRIPRP